MLKFKFLLWALTKLLQRAVKTKPACAKYVEGKELVFQIQTRDGMGRHFSIKNGKVSSVAGLTGSPKFTMTFRDAARLVQKFSSRSTTRCSGGNPSR